MQNCVEKEFGGECLKIYEKEFFFCWNDYDFQWFSIGFMKLSKWRKLMLQQKTSRMFNFTSENVMNFWLARTFVEEKSQRNTKT